MLKSTMRSSDHAVVGDNLEYESSLKQALDLREAETEVIANIQWCALKQHLLQAQKIPFYRELFIRHDFVPERLSALSDLSRIPFTSREDIDRNPNLFGTQDREAVSDIALTSGTTGEPVVVPYTRNDLERLALNEAIAFYSAGIKKGDKVLLTVTLDRCFIAGLAYYSGVTLLGGAAIRSGPGQPARQWEIINKLQPRVIVGVPGFLLAIGLWGKENGLDVAGSFIETIITIGEPVRKSDLSLTTVGQQLEELWGAKVYSSYGATELETAFGECAAQAGGHVHPELMVVEVIDDHGNPVVEGQHGEVVVTPLGVEGFPLVRFKTGDIARLITSSCTCGWNTARLGPIEGRLAQRLKYKGTTLYPESIFHALQETESVKNCYVEVRSIDNGVDDITVVVGCEDAEIDEPSLEEKLQAHLRVRPRVVIKNSAEVHSVMVKDGGRKPKKFFDFRSF